MQLIYHRPASVARKMWHHSKTSPGTLHNHYSCTAILQHDISVADYSWLWKGSTREGQLTQQPRKAANLNPQWPGQGMVSCCWSSVPHCQGLYQCQLDIGSTAPTSTMLLPSLVSPDLWNRVWPCETIATTMLTKRQYSLDCPKVGPGKYIVGYPIDYWSILLVFSASLQGTL